MGRAARSWSGLWPCCLLMLATVTTTTSEVVVRLADGSRWHEGFLEHKVDGTWLRLCRNSLSDNGTSVVCRQLGFPPENSTLSSRPVASGTATFSNSSFACTGNEVSLSSCTMLQGQCDQNEAVFVECQANVRLVGWARHNEGILEAYSQDTWAMVCGSSNSFTDKTASVVCKQLGYIASAYYTRSASWSGSGNGIAGPGFRCLGNETELHQCPVSSGICADRFIVVCNTGQVVAVPLRLVNGSTEFEGRVQLRKHGVWGTICGQSWLAGGSDVICRTLFGPTFSGAHVPTDVHVSSYGVQKAGVVFGTISCNGAESTISQCGQGTDFAPTCSYSLAVAIKCSLTDKELGVKLMDGSIDGSGVLYLRSNGQLTKACAADWDMADAVVVCRQLGYPTNVTGTQIRSSNSTERLDRAFHCVGNETDLRHCPSSVQECTNTNDVFVTCQASIRLVDGPAAHIGRLEIFDTGKWYPMCNRYFYNSFATVACRQLGYPTSTSSAVRHSAGAYGSQTANPYSYNFNCNGLESSLQECKSVFYSSSCGLSSQIALACVPESTETVPPPHTRLTGGNGAHEGFLEVFYLGIWSSICHVSWTSINSDVACQAMFGSNFTGKLVWEPQRRILFNETQLTPWQLLTQVGCTKDDRNILDCSRATYVFSCSRYGVALQCAELNSARLVNGTSDGSGVVEYLSEGRWAQVCAESWDVMDSAVVCRQLGYPPDDTIFTDQQVSSSEIHTVSFGCNGSETSLTECPTSTLAGCKASVFLNCTARVRLAGGLQENAGRLEIYRGGTWYSENGFNDPDFVCRTLGYSPDGARFYYPYRSDPASYQNVIRSSARSRFSCPEFAIHLSECLETYHGYTYSTSSDRGISCDTGTRPSQLVRLVNGTSPFDGRLEVFVAGSWSSLCDIYWSQSVLDVACRTMFGKSSEGRILHQNERYDLYGAGYSQSINPLLLYQLVCSGREASLADCSPSASISSCTHQNDIALKCITANVRLVNGTMERSGIVQYQSGGQWFHICHHNWDIENARVVCRELGFPTSGVEDASDDFTDWTSHPMLNQSFHCVGTENAMSDCRTSDLDLKRCSSTGPVAIRCSARVRLQDGPQDNAGRLEIYHSDGLWYRLHDYSFSGGVANIVCKQLGYQTTGSLYYTSRTFGTGSGPLFPYTVRYSDCNYLTSPDIRFCRWYRYTGGEDVGVSCDTGERVKPSARLLTGAKPTEGILQVHSNGVWGSVCGTDWTDTNSRVACREMFGPGFVGARVLLQSITSEKGIILLNNVRCNGHEETLLDCYKNIPAPKTCDRTLDVALKCFPGIDACGQMLDADSGNFSSPNYPVPYTSAEDCAWIINATATGDKIQLTLSHLNISETQCSTNHLEVVDSEDGKVLASYCGAGIPQPLTSEGSVLVVRLISSFDARGNSFRASWTTVCRNRLTDSEGVIQSPRYPNSPPPGKDCSYLIQRPPGEIITLSFDNFQLGTDDTNCNESYIEVHDGPSANAPLIGTRMCGNQLPPQLNSTQYTMWIQFRNRGSQNSIFRATYSSESPACSSDVLLADATSGTIQSPGYPYPYPSNALCSWTVSAAKGMRIRLNFTSVRTYGSPQSCAGHYVSVYDVTPGGQTNLRETFCGILGAQDISPILSGSNKLKIVFKSTMYYAFYWQNNQLNGFKAHYVTYSPNDSQYPLYSSIGQGSMIPLQLENDNTQALPYLETGIPVGRERLYYAFVSSNGLLTFGSEYRWPELDKSKAMVCAYASYIDLSSGGNVSYSIFDDATRDKLMLDKATAEVRDFTGFADFKARNALVVLWNKVKQRAADGVGAKAGEATFETVVVSDGRKTYSLINHEVGGMNWEQDSEWPPVTIGVSNSVSNEAQEPLSSKTNRAYSIDSEIGNTGRLGSWIYPLGEADPSPVEECKDWYTRNVGYRNTNAAIFAVLPKCPCSRRDVWRRARFTWTLYRSANEGKVHCYRLTKTASQRFYPYSKECCYGSDGGNSETFDQIILDAPYAGSALAYNPAYWALRDEHERDDRQAHEDCCIKSSDKYCNAYYELRPVGECQANIPFRFSWMFGDPHITTLDGRQYTFNGWGEYTMISIATPDLNFTLQGRTGLAVTADGRWTNATVFTAFAAEENGVRVFVGLDPNTENSFIIYVGEQDYSVGFRNKAVFEVEEDAFTLSKDNGSLVVFFSSNITFIVTIGMKSMDISVAMPLTYRNQTQGLLGNFNGDPDDEFILRNGTSLGSNLTERQIFETFGRDWTVTRSVMRYGPFEGPEDFAHPDFTPVFLDEQPPEVRQEAEAVCGDASNLACVYDYAATRNADFSKATGLTKDEASVAVKQSKNSRPQIVVPDNVNATEGEEVSIQIQGLDDDGDELEYFLTDGSNGTRKIDRKTGAINATFSVSKPTTLRVYATDGQGAQSPVRVIPIRLCTGCSGRGKCISTKQLPTDVPSATFQPLPCDCFPGYAGRDCEQELDACQDDPCLPGQTCMDLTAQQHQELGIGYNCTGCPHGYERRASICVDINECAPNSANDCAQLCENTAGSYVCACRPGFRLSSDGSTCVDVNECWEKVDGCNQTCANSEGSFQCGCWEGYSLGEDDKSCILNRSSSSSVCVNSGCSHGCRPVAVSTSSAAAPECFCFSGYQLNDDRITCEDIDECELGLCSQTCLNGVGDFACSCRKGYRLDERDNRTCLPCAELKYGLECRQTCACSGRGKKCDPVTGCVCRAGWAGSQCDEDVDECLRDPDACGEGRTCVNTDGSYSCRCLTGFAETSTDACTDIDECAKPTACGPLELCTNVVGSFYCTCIAGYKNENGTCIDIDECKLSGANCQQKCINVPGSYNCDCNYGYRLNADRASCVKVKDVCAEFENLNCSQGCSIGENDSAFCFCDTGYTLASDNQLCLDIDECLEDLANCTDTCDNTAGGFRCSCPVGMKLDNDRQTCIDCPAGTWGENCGKACSCGQGASHCNGSVGCVCQAGWTGAKCDYDINECDRSQVLQECQEKNAVCFNFRGGYRCQCRQGYADTGSGICTDVDECLSSPCAQQCENSEGSYRCLCAAGFILDSDGRNCNDKDECAFFTENPCTQRCDNTAGSFRCSCNVTGYTLANDGVTCQGPSTCSAESCDTKNGGCVLKNGTTTCFCNAGYTLNSDNVTCSVTDVDLCEQNFCEQLCTEKDYGRSFDCSCRPGFLLNSDARTCRECPQGTYGEDCGENCTCNALSTSSCNSTSGECVCHPGWQGGTCSDDVDECSTPAPGQSTPCPDHSVCTNTNGSYLCLCVEGFYKAGAVCQDVDECQQDTDGCSHGCVNENGTFHCVCPSDYTLQSDNRTCQDVDECQLDIDGCSHGCVNENGTFHCVCPSGYKLQSEKICEDVDECQLDTDGCSHDCVNENGTFHCVCPSGYSLQSDNRTCQDDDECQLETDGCSHDCVNENGTFHCVCPTGYTLQSDNRTCQDDDECQLDTDGCSHDCVNENGTFHCVCPTGYTLQSDNRTCQDDDECQLDTDGCSHDCVNENGTFHCVCPTGYTLQSNNRTCQDDDECQLDTDGCSHDCVNENGTFHCVCPNGYTLQSDNSTCQDDDECQLNTDGCSHDCVNENGTFYCVCPSGYTLQSNNRTCQDDDECQLNTDGCSHDCINENGTFHCVCPGGYTMQSDNKTCQDDDECQQNTDGCSHDCVNENGTFHCVCPSGYSLQSDNRTCQDDDECQQNTDGCSHDCVNENGTFHCVCPSGYTLQSDNRTCQDDDECQQNTDGCSHDCINENGTFHCECPSGYTLQSDNKTCQDDDECQLNTDGCSHDCVNENGTFHCVCPSGYTLQSDNRTCQDDDECQQNTDGCSHDCVNENGTFHCVCPSGYTLQSDNRTCQDVDECQLNTDGCSHDCVNENGTFHCVCPSGFTLQSDIKTCQESARLKLSLTIDVDVSFDENDPTSPGYLAVENDVKRILISAMDAVKGFLNLIISSIRKGSIIVDAQVNVAKEDEVEAAADVTTAMLNISQANLTVGNATGSTSVSFGNLTLGPDTKVCDALAALGSCTKPSEQCQEDDSGRPVCRTIQESKSEIWKVAAGLGLGIPIAVIIVVLVVCRVRQRKEAKQEAMAAAEQRTRSTPEPRHSELGNHGNADPKLRGWMDNHPVGAVNKHQQSPGHSNFIFYNGGYYHGETDERYSLPGYRPDRRTGYY